MPKTIYHCSSKGEEVIHIYVDGGTRGNQICLVEGRNKALLKRRKGKLTNNELEYLAVIWGIQYSISHFPTQVVHLHSDSKLIVQQTNGWWKITTQTLFPLWWKASNLLEKSEVKLDWCPRRFNRAGVYLEGLWDR